LDRVGILVVSKSLSAAAIIDTFSRSDEYSPQFFVAEKQVNPANFKAATEHVVIPDLDVAQIAKFASKNKGRIDFGITDTEDFVTAGGRDIVEKETKIPMVCVTKEYAVEASKADQRLLFEKICPEANPRYKVFDPKAESESYAVSIFKRFIDDMEVGVAIKPDAPARGAGVGVSGSDFVTEEEAVEFFKNVFSKGRVVVEERLEGEESSFHAFSDGKHFVPAPLTRDYKRALDGNKGKLTGGMGSYRGKNDVLPFLSLSDWESAVKLETRAFERWKGKGSNPGLRGIVLYDALMHTKDGFKILERNSRGGNTEQICILTTMVDDYVDVCFKMVEGNLKGIRFSNRAAVVTCAVPLSYGTGGPAAEPVAVDLSKALAVSKKSKGSVRVFPMDLRLEGGKTIMGTSRSVAVAGLGGSTSEAHAASVAGVRALSGPFRYRKDVGSNADIERSRRHLRKIRA
jgi:phosphoribosylamine---glycine ligase